MPLGVFVDEVPLSVEGVGRGVVVRVECVQLAHVQHGGAQVGRSVCERAMRPVLGAEAARVRVVYAHASFVVAQVISSLRVACCTMQERTPDACTFVNDIYTIMINLTIFFSPHCIRSRNICV